MYLYSFLRKTLQTFLGLMLFSVGVYLTIQANIGVAPWDVFSLGLINHLPITYGNASVMVSITIVIIDLLLKEPIGFGTVLDAVLIGKTIDLLNAINLVPKQDNFFLGLMLMLLGICCNVVAQRIYISAGLGAGPRDNLLMGIGKRLRKLNIGTVSWILNICVVTVGWILGGPAGLGTIIAVVSSGFFMRVIFRIMRFEPRNITHESLITTAKRLSEDLRKKAKTN